MHHGLPGMANDVFTGADRRVMGTAPAENLVILIEIFKYFFLFCTKLEFIFKQETAAKKFLI